MQGSPLLERPRLLAELQGALEQAPVAVLLGGRQTGKTTLARMFAHERTDVTVFDLDRVEDRAALATPELTLSALRGMVLIDEVQRLPHLFELLRPLADRRPLPARFLLLGSASPEVVRGVSESLAGRVHFIQIPGFGLDEVGAGALETLWCRGLYPVSYLASSDQTSMRWRANFVATLLERDVPLLGLRVPAEALRRFWTMLAHYHGQLWNGAALGRSMGVTEKTARHYLDILQGLFLVRVLQPWHENLKKRQIKAPKVYVRDCGLLHALLGLETMLEVRAHPTYGASFEGFALEQVLARVGEHNAYFWRTQAGAELDLMVLARGRRIGFEFKCSDAPSMTKSLHCAVADLDLAKAFVVYPGNRRFPLHPSVEALPLKDLWAIDPTSP